MGSGNGVHEHERFTFLGFEIGAREALGTEGRIVDKSCRRSARRLPRRFARRCEVGLHRRSHHSLTDLALDINAVVRGWVNYY
jgi:hypothetical protein